MNIRVYLSDEVMRQDVDRVLSLVRRSMKQVGIDPEINTLDVDIMETGQSKSQRERRKRMLAIISDRNGPTVDEVAAIADADRKKRARHSGAKETCAAYEVSNNIR